MRASVGKAPTEGRYVKPLGLENIHGWWWLRWVAV